MPTPRAQTILQDYAFHNMLIHRFVDGVSHAESVLQLPFKHNCMNWILGHIVTNRSHVLETAGAAHAWQDETRALYQQDTPPVLPGSPSLHFETLVKYLDGSIEQLTAALENISDEYLEGTYSNYRGEKTRYAHLASFHWHEAFHVGQLEILRAFIESKR